MYKQRWNNIRPDLKITLKRKSGTWKVTGEEY